VQQQEEGPLWFTSLEEFKPLEYAFHSGRYVTAFFACRKVTGEHFVLKRFDKGGWGQLAGAGAGRSARCMLSGCRRAAAGHAAAPQQLGHVWQGPTPCPPLAAAEMTARDERGVRRAIALSQQLRHPYLVQCMGLWESAGEGQEGGRCACAATVPL
jgi:hypothetical protein